MWLAASAVIVAWDVLFGGTEGVSRVFEVNGLAFYSQVPWLLAVIVVAWHYQPPFPEGVRSVDPARLLRLLREDEILLVVRTINQGSTLWLHLLFGAGYHAVSRVPLPRCLLIAAAIFAMPQLIEALA
jgi:hypothetical protein